jgi:hypothetical protein
MPRATLEGELDVVVLRPRLGVFFRAIRLHLVLLAVTLGVAMASVATAGPYLGPHLDHQMEAVGLLVVIYAIVYCVLVPPFIRRTGFYARPGEVGSLRINGSRRLPASPVTHFVRLVVVNKLGFGGLRATPVAYGLNESGQRVVSLSTLANDRREIDAFIKASALPVSDEAPEPGGVIGLGRRFPMAPEARAQVQQGLLLLLPFLLLLVAGLVYIFVKVH